MIELKLFVWEDVLCDYSCGVMFALAPDVETARKMILKEINTDELDQDPIVVTEPRGFYCWGGG